MKPKQLDDQLMMQSTVPKSIPSPPQRSEPPRLGRASLFIMFLESKLFAWLPAVSFAFMIYSSITAVYQSNYDPGTIAFVAASLSILGALYLCMHEFEKAVSQRATAKKERLKLAIWLLAMALNTLFSYRVTTVIESTVFSIIIWSIAGVTTAVGCYLMYFSPEKASDVVHQ